MSPRGMSKDVLDTVKKATGKQVSEQSIKNIANGVTPKTVQDPTELEKLIDRVAKLVNIPVSQETKNQIVKAVKSVGNVQQLENMMKNMMKK